MKIRPVAVFRRRQVRDVDDIHARIMCSADAVRGIFRSKTFRRRKSHCICGEKIDVIEDSEDLGEFIASALSPAEVIAVEFDSEKSARVTVALDQLSLAIGKEGQNARLAAKLTGCKIDIKGI